MVSPPCYRSLPSRERGLKYFVPPVNLNRSVSLPSRERGLKCSALCCHVKQFCVAPFTGAWIEMLVLRAGSAASMSLPSRERGLKSRRSRRHTPMTASLPSRERGLKLRGQGFRRRTRWTSLPSRERGLKCSGRYRRGAGRHRSLPSRERGLK